MPHHSFLLAMAAIANNDGSGDQFNRPAPAHTFAESTHFSGVMCMMVMQSCSWEVHSDYERGVPTKVTGYSLV
jgi:hypothetical protein